MGKFAFKRGTSIMDRICFEPNTGCWLWMGNCGSKGYGMVKKNGKILSVHRIVFEQFKGALPKGLELDHLCRVRSCCNPDHLEPVTHKENIQRGINGNLRHLKPWATRRKDRPRSQGESSGNQLEATNEEG